MNPTMLLDIEGIPLEPGKYKYTFVVKLRQGSGKDRQGMALKVRGLKA